MRQQRGGERRKSAKSRKSENRLIARGVRPDSRNRLSLGPAIRLDENASFNIYWTESGAILLEPQVLVPAGEAWLYRNREALASVYRGLEELGNRETEDLGSFAEYADE